MKVVAYLRVSSNAQAERDTISQQRTAVRKWAKANGHDLVAVCEDEAVSGKIEAAGRPGLLAVLDALDAGKAEGVVFKDLDRLARSVTVQEAALGHFWARGATVLTYIDGTEILRDDPSDPMRTAMRQMSAVFNQLESGLIRMRMESGKTAKRERGGYVDGAPAFGLQAVGKELVPDEVEQKGVDFIMERHNAGHSFRQIVADLNAEGISSKRGGQWHPITVSRVVKRHA